MFFEDICTITELKALAQRFTVAYMLKNGKTYNEIVEATGASSATISRVNRFIKYGADGYNCRRASWRRRPGMKGSTSLNEKIGGRRLPSGDVKV